MAGCTISPAAFTMAMEVIILASRLVVGGECLKSGMRLPPIRAYMDDLTIITTTNACTKRLLYILQENIRWARMEIKPSKSQGHREEVEAKCSSGTGKICSVKLTILDSMFLSSLQVISLFSTPSHLIQRPCLAWDTALAHLSASSW
ncbi:hypothetical protein DPEC_G00282280 [Dallia pectoralis]|uniref:Uncharacterized protein n=1 Tax=Dallia pectoralis TaxID=75939 RepID=A0ACC2FMU5_DALPE|nr:hypothetical protein DPEC_G00282280 [Dallia pectoralis]